MNLLKDPWIPIQQSGIQEKITLQQLLCDEKEGDLCLPRDDMEMACLQLLVAITQVLFTPENKKALVARVKTPLTAAEFLAACEGKEDWFDLEHENTPFMQFRGVKAKDTTPLDKLMAGLADGTSKPFVNPEGLATQLCGGCAAIALFNTANNCPGMGGGFKASLRGSTPITVMVRQSKLRTSIWVNLLTKESWHKAAITNFEQAPNYVDLVKAGATFDVSAMGVPRGLLWQPAHFELVKAESECACSLCGSVEAGFVGFKKEKFNYTANGHWPHPLSSRTFSLKGGKKEFKTPSFTTTQPTWVHLGKLLATLDKGKEGYEAAPVIQQLRGWNIPVRTVFIGGYRNNQATILERRHEMISLADRWPEHADKIDELVVQALEYKTALRRGLYLFSEGIKDKVPGSGVNRCAEYDDQFFQQTEQLIRQTLLEADFDHFQHTKLALQSELRRVVLELFAEATDPYQHDPKMLKALAVARKMLIHKYLKTIEIPVNTPEEEAINE
ncbi:MAG: type I-E CRISPR-associated protein Cse1/CasA [Pontibacterium sp.]